MFLSKSHMKGIPLMWLFSCLKWEICSKWLNWIPLSGKRLSLENDSSHFISVSDLSPVTIKGTQMTRLAYIQILHIFMLTQPFPIRSCAHKSPELFLQGKAHYLAQGFPGYSLSSRGCCGTEPGPCPLQRLPGKTCIHLMTKISLKGSGMILTGITF